MAAAKRAASSTPGVVTFAAVVLFVLAGLHAIYAVSEFADSLWALDRTEGIAGGDLWVWGIVDSVIAVLLATGGVSLLAGHPYGRWIAIIWAILAAIRWLYWIPAAPLFSVVMVVIAMVVLYAATVYPEHDKK